MSEGHSTVWLEVKGVKGRIAVDQVKAIERTFVYAERTPFGSDDPYRIIERTRYDGTLQIGNESVHYRLSPRELPTPRGWFRATVVIEDDPDVSALTPWYRPGPTTIIAYVEVKARTYVAWKAFAKRSSLSLDRDELDDSGRAVDPIWELEGDRFSRELVGRYRYDRAMRWWVPDYRGYRADRWPDRGPKPRAKRSAMGEMLDWVSKHWHRSR